MAISPDKCVLRVTSLELLSHIVSTEGIIPTLKKVQGIVDYARPTSQKETLRYLGMLNYYRRSLPNIATVLQPLYEAATRKLEKGQKFEWNPTLQKAFDTSKTRLKNHALLVHPDTKAPLAIVKMHQARG